MKLSNAIQEYLKEKSVETKYTASRYRPWLHRLLEKIGDRELDTIPRYEIVSFLAWVKENWKPKTLEYCAAIITNFSYKNKLDWVIKIRRQRADSHEAISEEVYKKILDLCPTNEFKYLQRNIIVRILHETGCRISECLAINLDDISIEAFAEVPTRKTVKDRRIYWGDETHKLILEKYLPIRKEIPRQSDALFIGLYVYGEYSDRLTPRAVERWYVSFSRQLGLKCVPHGARHGKAHNILDLGGTLSDVQNILGHTSPLSSHKYTGYGGREALNRARKFL